MGLGNINVQRTTHLLYLQNYKDSLNSTFENLNLLKIFRAEKSRKVYANKSELGPSAETRASKFPKSEHQKCVS